MQRTGSSPSALRSLLMRCPLDGRRQMPRLHPPRARARPPGCGPSSRGVIPEALRGASSRGRSGVRSSPAPVMATPEWLQRRRQQRADGELVAQAQRTHCGSCVRHAGELSRLVEDVRPWQRCRPGFWLVGHYRRRSSPWPTFQLAPSARLRKPLATPSSSSCRSTARRGGE